MRAKSGAAVVRVQHIDGRLGTLRLGHSLDSRFLWVAVDWGGRWVTDVSKSLLRRVGPVEWELRHLIVWNDIDALSEAIEVAETFKL